MTSPERKSSRTELETNIKLSNSNNEEFNKQVTAEGEEMNVKNVTIDIKRIEKFAKYSHPNRTGKQAAEK